MRMYKWTLLLLIFSGAGTIGTIGMIIVTIYLKGSISNFTKYEVGSVPYMFEYQPQNATVKVDFEESALL